ncbi:MAG: hypothetical protein WA989_15725 [Henriciella sp.]|uniref:hypothetical protein n=1 Tax=Henriciella sp. TaxID=1968823 RepID=UPI003C76339A
MSETFTVDPARLAAGTWCHKRDRMIGEGDIAASYSADRIGLGKPVRTPFRWCGGSYICVGMQFCGGTQSARAYRLCDLRVFDGEPVTYRERCANGDAARADSMGFYHGMRVRHGGRYYVLCGPEASFVPGKTEQLALF